MIEAILLIIQIPTIAIMLDTSFLQTSKIICRLGFEICVVEIGGGGGDI